MLAHTEKNKQNTFNFADSWIHIIGAICKLWPELVCSFFFHVLKIINITAECEETSVVPVQADFCLLKGPLSSTANWDTC